MTNLEDKLKDCSYDTRCIVGALLSIRDEIASLNDTLKARATLDIAEMRTPSPPVEEALEAAHTLDPSPEESQKTVNVTLAMLRAKCKELSEFGKRELIKKYLQETYKANRLQDVEENEYSALWEALDRI